MQGCLHKNIQIKIIDNINKSMVGYANDVLKGIRTLTMCEYADALRGVEVVTAKYASA